MNQKRETTIQNTDEPKIMADSVYWVNLSFLMHFEGMEIKLLLHFTLLFVLC